VLFLLDYSGSMGGALIREAMASMHELVREHIQDDDNVALTRFTHVPKEAVLGWTPKGGNEQQITAAIDDCRNPSGATSLWDALEQALDQSPADADTKPFWIVLLTDGMDSTSQGRFNSEYQYNPDGTRVRRADFVEDRVHEANMMARCQSVLLPKVQQYKDQNKLGGIVAIAGCRNQSAKRRKTHHLILPANMRGNLLGNRWDVVHAARRRSGFLHSGGN